jgi:hypothetical protein
MSAPTSRHGALRGSSPAGPVTLGDLVREGVDLLGCCDSCGRSELLPLQDLAERLGEAFTVPALRGRLKCSRCGSRETSARPDYIYRGPNGI